MVYRPTMDDRAFDDTHQRTAFIWSQLVTMVQNVRPLNGFIRTKQDEIRVLSHCNASLAILEASNTSGSGRKPFHHLLERVAPAPNFGPNRRQTQLQRRDSAPRFEEVTRFR